MTTPRPDKDRPEAGADTTSGRQGQGANERDGDSGGHRSAAGGTYGDFVPDRGQARKNDDRDTDAAMGDYYTGGGNIDRLADEPAGRRASHSNAGASPDAGPQGDAPAAGGEDDDGDAERVAEANRNKSFDTAHVHTGTTTRKV
jgi:hypothetical protein